MPGLINGLLVSLGRKFIDSFCLGFSRRENSLGKFLGLCEIYKTLQETNSSILKKKQKKEMPIKTNGKVWRYTLLLRGSFPSSWAWLEC